MKELQIPCYIMCTTFRTTGVQLMNMPTIIDYEQHFYLSRMPGTDGGYPTRPVFTQQLEHAMCLTEQEATEVMLQLDKLISTDGKSRFTIIGSNLNNTVYFKSLS